jgi:AmiR/NasT family two-component response regulator
MPAPVPAPGTVPDIVPDTVPDTVSDIVPDSVSPERELTQDELRRLVDELRLAVTARHAIGLAQGLLMYRYKLDADAAFAVMVRLSSHQNVKLRDIAAGFLEEFRTTGGIA